MVWRYKKIRANGNSYINRKSKDRFNLTKSKKLASSIKT